MGGRLGQSPFDASSRETFEYLIAKDDFRYPIDRGRRN
jgi:hypothetical protein